MLGDYTRSQRMRQLSLQRLNVSDSQVPTKGGLGGHVISQHFYNSVESQSNFNLQVSLV